MPQKKDEVGDPREGMMPQKKDEAGDLKEEFARRVLVAFQAFKEATQAMEKASVGLMEAAKFGTTAIRTLEMQIEAAYKAHQVMMETTKTAEKNALKRAAEETKENVNP